MSDVREPAASLWLLPSAPVLWAVHFLASYATAALWCGKFAGADGSLLPARIAIAAYTVVALIAMMAIGYHAYRRHASGGSPLPHDSDSPEDRDRFLGFATLLLSGLSVVATVYTSFAALFIRSCAG